MNKQIKTKSESRNRKEWKANIELNLNGIEPNEIQFNIMYTHDNMHIKRKQIN